MKTSALLLLAPLAGAVATPPAPQDDPEVVHGEVGARLDRYLTRLERLGFSGSALVAEGDDVLLAKGYGMADRARGVPNTPRTVVSLGSITKHFTGALVVKLQSEGVLSTGDTLDVFFPDVPEDKRGITLHHLLCHSSGLPDSMMMIRGAGDRDAYVRAALDTGLMFPPGRGFSYSNTNFGLAAAAVEVATGERYEDVVQELLFEPAGMARSGLASDLWEPGDLAHGYIDGRDVGTLLGGDGSYDWSVRGAGGLHSTVYDMLRWSRALDAGTVLPPEALDALLTPHARGYGYGTGVGKSVRGTPRIGHSGSNDVFCALFRWFPEDGVTIHVQSNDADLYAEDVAPVLERIVFGAEVSDPPEVVALAEGELAAYEGDYELESGGAIRVVAEPDRLLISSGDADGAALVHRVRGSQADRRDMLVRSLAEAYAKCFEGDLAPLHQLLDPYAPFEEFAEMRARRMDQWTSALGAFQGARGVPGRNRFGEIAVIAVLEFDRGTRRIEYSFGDGEIGSIRTMDAFPQRVLRPSSREELVAYEADTGEVWRVRVELDDGGAPAALVLADERGAEHVARRRDR